MIRSLRTGISGLKSNQVRMDVVGNNIANVNTTAFKRSRAAFQEVLGQQMLGVGRTAGGSSINPSFVGLGVAAGSIDQNWAQGALENTGLATDLAISGDGFFVARAGDRKLLTRAGNFTVDRNGNLTTGSGLNVQGWGFDADGRVDMGNLKDLQLDLKATIDAKKTTEVTLGGNLSSNTAPGPATAVPPGEPVTIASTVYDSNGDAHTIQLTFEKAPEPAINSWNVSANLVDGTTLTPLTVTGGTATPITLEFDDAGNIVSPVDPDGDPLPFNVAGANFPGTASDAVNVDIDLSAIRQYSGSTTATVRGQDGYEAGQLVGYSINPQGILQGNFSNGQQKNMGQLALATVNNPNGLEPVGENAYSLTGASGDMQFGRAGSEFRATIAQGALEMSNVDLANEFTEMIVTQRGYQAAARVITTSDELLQETVQLKR